MKTWSRVLYNDHDRVPTSETVGDHSFVYAIDTTQTRTIVRNWPDNIEMPNSHNPQEHKYSFGNPAFIGFKCILKCISFKYLTHNNPF
jgi:hypothetical protein